MQELLEYPATGSSSDGSSDVSFSWAACHFSAFINLIYSHWWVFGSYYLSPHPSFDDKEYNAHKATHTLKWIQLIT